MVLLIYPKVSSGTQNNYLSSFIFNSIPISLGFLAGYLEKNGVEAKIIDEQINPVDSNSIKNELLKLPSPKIVGLSVLTSTYKRSIEIASLIKKIDSSVCVIIGGIHPSSCPEQCLNDPCFDIIVRGEGEKTFYDLILALRAKTSLKLIDGISYKDKSTIIHNPDRPLIQDLDEIPAFPYHLFSPAIKLYKEFGIIVSSRGCPYQCIFCSSRNISNHRYRSHSLQRVISDLDILINKYKQARVSFLDDNMLSDKQRFFKIIDEIISRGYQKHTQFYLCARGRDIDEELCERVALANFELAINFETGSNRMMKFIKKAETLEDNINAVTIAKKYGINVTSVFIFGFPQEHQEDRDAAIKLSRTVPMDSVRFNIAVPYPGTELFDIAKKNNQLFIKGKYENFSVQYYIESDDLPYSLPEQEKTKVIFDTFYANLSFYLRPRILFKNLFNKSFAGHAISLDTKHPFLMIKNGLMLYLLLTRRFICIIFRMLIQKVGNAR